MKSKKYFNKLFLWLIAFIFVMTILPQKIYAEPVSGLKVHYIDVGQADSILVQQGDSNMLIDAGNNADANTVVEYLKSQNVSKLDFLVLTHPHEDHIGGADAVIKDFDINTVYMPKVTTTTKTFKDVVLAMKNKDYKATAPNPGDTFKLGDADCTILSPINSEKGDLNTYSIVLKVQYGNNKFLFTGDAQASNEQDMINADYDLSADVLKVGHHGSHTSTSEDFLNAVNPQYAVISCGKGNDYGHPHKEVMERLQAKGIPVYRTDEAGSIICTSDGETITFNCEAGDYTAGGSKETKSSDSATGSTDTNASSDTQTVTTDTTQNDKIVYYTPGGKSYHYDKNCSTLKRSKTILEGNLQDVINMGKSDPCDKCVK